MKSLSTDTKVYASLALFRKMRDNNVDILDVVETLAVNAALINKKDSFSKDQLSKWTLAEYGFEIPDGAIDLILKRKNNFQIVSTRPLKIDLCEKFNPSKLKDYNDQLSDLNRSYSTIENLLCEYIEKGTGGHLDEQHKSQVKTALYNHLLDKENKNDYTTWVLRFIIDNEQQPNFKEALDQLLEGLLLYIGLNADAKDKNLKSFISPLVLILDTEILFHLSGYHGNTFRNRAKQFVSYVEEVNQARYGKETHNGKKIGRIVQLKYLPSTKAEIKRIFNAVENAKRNYGIPKRGTMVEEYLRTHCSSASSVVEELQRFWKSLDNMSIKEVGDMTNTDDEKFQLVKSEDYKIFSDIESTEDAEPSLMEKDEHEKGFMVSEEDTVNNLIENSDFDNVSSSKIDAVYYHLVRLNEVYALRGGNLNDNRLEKAKYVLISDTSDVLRKSYRLHRDGTIRNSYYLAQSLSAISVTFWLRLNKGLSSEERPLSYDILAKTRCSLANIAGEALIKEHKNIYEQVKAGQLTTEKAAEKISALRNIKKNADDFKDADDVTPLLQESAVNFWQKMNQETMDTLRAENEEKEKTIQDLKKKLELKAIRDEEIRYESFMEKRNSDYKIHADNLKNLRNIRYNDIRKSMCKEWRKTIVWIIIISLMIGLSIFTFEQTKVFSYCIAGALVFIMQLILNIKNDNSIMHSLRFLFNPSFRRKVKKGYIKEYEQTNPKPSWVEPEFK